jgi:tetratricopeptide (TPR) repeat protein
MRFKMNKSKRYLPFLAAALLVLVSCQSLQKDILLSVDEGGSASAVSELEDIIVPLDREAGPNELRAARAKVQELETRSVGDNLYKALLAAWSGRLYLLEGRPLEAERQAALSRSLSPGNIQALILSIRLERDVEKRLAIINDAARVETSSGELNIELGRTLLELRQFSEAVAAFDTAFAQLKKEVYESAYRGDRERAWEFRNLGSGLSNATANILAKPALTWRDALYLTAQETDILNFITAGKNRSEEELFRELSALLFIPPAQDTELSEWPARASLAINDTMQRTGAAWFLWRLYAELRHDRSLLSRRSTQYRSSGRSSPIPDVPLNSVYFDAVLGCIEREIMTLPDGRNFQSGGSVRGAAFYDMLKKVQP